jgi:hypothetical protein
MTPLIVVIPSKCVVEISLQSVALADVLHPSSH